MKRTSGTHPWLPLVAHGLMAIFTIASFEGQAATQSLDNLGQSKYIGEANSLRLSWPAKGVIRSRFGEQDNKGIDIVGEQGDPVLAAADGSVVYAGSRLHGYGNLVIIKHNDTFLTTYAHNQSLLVREREFVRAGQQIARMGRSDSDSVKLRFEVRMKGKPVDPEQYLVGHSDVAATPPEKATTPSRPNNLSSAGSGFSVASTMVVTNAHVIDGCARVMVVGRGLAKVRAVDERNDLALIEAPASLPVATLSEGRSRQGDSVVVIGYPLPQFLAAGPQVTVGNISALAGLGNDTGRFQISAGVQLGSSGGPVLDSSGNVIGVVVSKLNALKAAASTGDIPQNVNFAVSLQTLRGFLDAHGVSYRLATATKGMEPSDVADIGKPYTASIQCFG